MEDLAIITIKPNSLTTLPLEEAYQESLSSISEDTVYSCRVIIQDEHDFGIVIPAELIQGKEISFNLPEQLCIFNPSKTYILKTELVLEDQLIIPFISNCLIDLEGLTVPEDMDNEEENVNTEEASEQPLIANSEDIDGILAMVAPMPIEQKKTKLEELAKALDEEFIKQALFNTTNKQKAPEPIKTPEPNAVIELTPEKLALKQRMKALLKDMLE